MSKNLNLERSILLSVMTALAVGALNIGVCAEDTILDSNYRESYLKFAEESDNVANSPLYATSGMIMADFDADGIPELLSFSASEGRYNEDGEIVMPDQESYKNAYIKREYEIEKGFYLKGGKVVESSPWNNSETGRILNMSYLPEDTPVDTEFCTTMVRLNSTDQNALFMMYSDDVSGYVENLITFNKDTGFDFDYAHNKAYNEFYYDGYFGDAEDIPTAVNVSYYDPIESRLRTKREAMEILLDKYDESKASFDFYSNYMGKWTKPDDDLVGIEIKRIDGKYIDLDLFSYQFAVRIYAEVNGDKAEGSYYEIWDDGDDIPKEDKFFDNYEVSGNITLTFRDDEIDLNWHYVEQGEASDYTYKLVKNEILVTLDGRKIDFDQPPVIVNDRTLVPLRAIFEALGATVDWNDNTRTVTAKKDGVFVSLAIGSDKLYVDDKEIALDVPAQIVNDRTLVPVRAVSESFGCKVDWNGDTKTVTIKN